MNKVFLANPPTLIVNPLLLSIISDEFYITQVTLKVKKNQIGKIVLNRKHYLIETKQEDGI